MLLGEIANSQYSKVLVSINMLFLEKPTMILTGTKIWDSQIITMDNGLISTSRTARLLKDQLLSKRSELRQLQEYNSTELNQSSTTYNSF